MTESELDKMAAKETENDKQLRKFKERTGLYPEQVLVLTVKARTDVIRSQETILYTFFLKTFYILQIFYFCKENSLGFISLKMFISIYHRMHL